MILLLLDNWEKYNIVLFLNKKQISFLRVIHFFFLFILFFWYYPFIFLFWTFLDFIISFYEISLINLSEEFFIKCKDSTSNKSKLKYLTEQTIIIKSFIWEVYL